MREISYTQAIAEAQSEEMRRDPTVFIVGTDVQSRLFSSGMNVDEFGFERIRNAPISESGFTGLAAGAAMVGMRPIVQMSIAIFMYSAMDPLISIVAKTQYLYGGQAKMPIVIRCMMYHKTSSAAQHSDRPYPMFMNVPGLKIIAPATPYDMKGLLKAAIRDEDPVLCFEDGTQSSTKGPVPEDDYVLPIGKADIKRSGSDLTIVAVSGAVVDSLEAAETLSESAISAEVVDVRTLVPLDKATILESVARTGRVVIVDPACRTCSAASEITAIIAEEAFWDLTSPIRLVTTPDVHVPFSRPLEMSIYPNADKIVQAAKFVVAA